MEKNFRSMNIYCDIYPFIETQILVGEPADKPELRYINANRIRSVYGETNE